MSQGPIADCFGRPATGGPTVSNLSAYLGPPGKEVRYNAEDDISKEFFTVADTYRGRNVYLEKTVEAMVARSYNAWVLQRFFKMRQFNDINFAATMLKANRALFVRTAPHAPPTYVSSKEITISATMGRYELAFTAAIENLDNADGQAKARLNIANMGAALGDTMEQQAIESLRDVKNVWREYNRKSHAPLGSVVGLFQNEVWGWDLLHKYEDGSGGLKAWGAVQQSMRDYYVTAAIFPQDGKALLAAGEANSHYRIHGPGARANAVLVSDSRAASYDGVLDVFVVRQFTIDRDRKRTQPLHREREIGAHIRFSDYSSTCSPAAYRACSRNLMAFTMADLNGRFVTLDFADAAFRDSERFKSDAEGTLDDMHDKIAADPAGVARAVGLGDTISDGFYDMFIFKDDKVHRTVQVVGQMEPQALTYSTLRRVAETMRARQLEAIGVDGERAITAGQALIDRLYGEALTADDVAQLQRVVQTSGASASGQGGPIPSTGEAAAALGEGRGEKGFGHAVGLFSLAANASHPDVKRVWPKEHLDTAVAFTAAYDKWFTATAAMLSPSHPLLSGALVDEHFAVDSQSPSARVQNAKNAIAANLFDSNKAPLVFTGDVRAAPVAAPASALSAPIFAPSTDSEQERVLDAIRLTIAPYASASVATALATSDAAADFVSAYEESPFAEAFAKHASESASRSSRKSLDKSFHMFASTKLVALIDSSGAAAPAVAGIMDGLVRVIAERRATRPQDIESTLRRWAAAGTSSASTSGASRATTSGLVTRFVVDPVRLAEAGASSFSVLHPFERMPTSNARDPAFALDSRTHTHRAFAMARSALWQSRTGERVGAKRSGANLTPGDFPEASRRIPLPDRYTEIVRTEHFLERWAAAGGEQSRLVGANVQLLLLAPVTRRTFERLHAANVGVPLDVLAETPFMTFEAASALFISEVDGFAILAWAKYNVMLGVNMANQTITGMMSIWFVPIPLQEDRFLLFEDLMVTGFRGGQDFAPFRRASFAFKNKGRGSGGATFFFLEPYGSLRGTRVPRVHDIRGHFEEDLLAGGRLTADEHQLVTKHTHHPSALYYTKVFSLYKARPLGADAADHFVRPRHDNTITFQHAQRIYDLPSDTFSRGIVNTGHQGPNIYDGVGAVWSSGRTEFIKEMNYEKKFAPED